MRAMLLAAGMGSRLKPLTNTLPKCLAPIHGDALLDIWLHRLTDAGVDQFLINTHYMVDVVTSHIQGSPYKRQITLMHEPKLLGTAGTLLSNLSFFNNQDGMLIHADNYCLADLKGFIHAHNNRPSDCLMTMMTFRTTTPSSCGIVEIDCRGVVTALYEKNEDPPGNLANGAIYILSPQLLKMLQSKESAAEFTTEILPDFMNRIYTYETSEIFLDIGTPQSYAQANALAVNSLC